ncbi:MAG: PilZ domain-containing protein [Elusimicrobiota bacterium]
MIKKDRRKHPRIPVAADLAEPIEIAVLRSADSTPKSKVKALRIPAILANISPGGMALVAFGSKKILEGVDRIRLVSNLPGLNRVRLDGTLVHLRDREGVQTLGVRFTCLAEKVRNRLRHIVDDYADCETRAALNIPEICVGSGCHFFNLCKKAQKILTP